jgi:hypothetical protein
MYAGATPREVVDRMREHGLFTASKTTPEYMRFVARRLESLNGVHISARSAGEFLMGLETAGLITTVKEH